MGVLADVLQGGPLSFVVLCLSPLLPLLLTLLGLWVQWLLAGGIKDGATSRLPCSTELGDVGGLFFFTIRILHNTINISNVNLSCSDDGMRSDFLDLDLARSGFAAETTPQDYHSPGDEDWI